ncbi:MAG: glycosyltransferase [Proteobacteria bacterium]|nr:glycosyltransferase [Pseudomonadota bacterium]
MHNLFRKIIRTATYNLFRHCTKQHWQLLRYYPPVTPDQETLQRWQHSEWPQYQDWIDRHSLLTTSQWQEQHNLAKKANGKTKITIVTPVYNTDPCILKECILSVRTQTSPFWELILVDDGSTNKETHTVLRSKFCRDPRIRVFYSEEDSSSGISSATNRGIDAARGEYIVFLDHDDRIAPEAIQLLISTIKTDPELGIIYSDRDMLSPGGKRFMHLMKPDWSPDNLYGGNYIFHLMCYRLDLIIQAGKLRSEFDGSQDYDLILRCMELAPKVKHLPQVLYHWRQHAESVSMDAGAKNYAFEAGMAALRDTLRRRKIKATVKENKLLWRGNYQIELPLPPKDQIGYITLPTQLQPDQYVTTILTSPVLKDPPPYIFIQWEGCVAKHDNSARILASWLDLENIGITSGCLTNEEEKFIYAGMIYNEKGECIAPYAGYDSSEPGYMAATKTARNISAPNPYSVMIKRELWQQLGGFDTQFHGAYALLDFALSALHTKWRIAYVPLAAHTCNPSPPIDTYSLTEQKTFYRKWEKWLEQGDPYYSVNLRKNNNNYELA